jgi:hypothetical protein
MYLIYWTSILKMNEYESICTLLGVLILLCILIHAINHRKREKFVSPEAIKLANKSKELLTSDASISFTAFKNKCGKESLDVVEYDGIKKLWKDGNLSPENVQDLL